MASASVEKISSALKVSIAAAEDIKEIAEEIVLLGKESISQNQA